VRADLAHGEPVLVDATFRNAADRAAFAAALPLGCEPLFFHCSAPARVLRERVSARSKRPNVSDADERVLASQRFDALDEIPRSHRRTLRTNRRVDDVVRDLEAQLDERLRVSPPQPALRPRTALRATVRAGRPRRSAHRAYGP
jgi:predicted kinase